jgi:endo-1,4-beta-xylanase
MFQRPKDRGRGLIGLGTDPAHCGTALTRRAALVKFGSLVGGAAAAAAPLSDLDLQPGLRNQSRKSGIKFGIAGPAPDSQPEARLLGVTAAEANIFAPEWALKWMHTEPQPNGFDFSDADSLANFARRHDMLMHGHTLVWYAALPRWVTELTLARAAEAALERHIATLVQRYRRQIWAWDVVNEPVDPADGLPDGHRKSIWYRLLGPTYLDLAFRLARQADPAVALGLNEYGIEYVENASQAKRAAFLTLLRKLRERNVPVDRVGLQSHLDAHRTLDRKGLTDFLRAVRALGCELMVTELDVNDVKIPGDIRARDLAVSRHADEYLDIIHGVARPLSITTWGLTDRHSWLRQYNKRADRQPLRPLAFDADLNRKPLWATLARYLSA